MLARVTSPYTDRLTGSIHLVGEEVDLAAGRLAELSEGGFVEGTEPASPLIDSMTVAELRGLISERGGTAPKGATKAKLAAIARGL